MARETKNILVNHIVEKELKQLGAKYLKGRLLDIGCGTKPYQSLFAPYVIEHVGVDHEGTLHNQSNIDLFGTAYNIPVEDNAFDSAICTAVLEHLEEPEKAIAECHRVLKKEAVAIFSVPFIWHLHEEPRDFYRYSKFGLKYLFEKHNFEVLEIKALAGFWVTFGQLFVYYLYRFRKGGKINPLWWVIPPIGLIIQGLAYLFDKIDCAEQWTWMYSIAVRKK